MKTLIGKTAAILALAFMTTGAFATETKDEKKDAPQNEVKTVVELNAGNTVDVELNIDNATEGESTVDHYRRYGNVVLADTFEHDAATINKTYELPQAPEGDYVIRVTTAEPTLQK